MKYFVLNSSCLSSSSQCRMDAKYNIFCSIDKRVVFKDFPEHILLSDILQPLTSQKVKKGELDEGMYIINISDQEPGYGELIYENIVKLDEVNSDKTILTDSDIIISKLGMTRAYIYITPKLDAQIIGSSEYIPYKIVNRDQLVFYKHLLLHPEMRKAYESLETGKTPSHKRVNPEEFLKIAIPFVEDHMIQRVSPEIRKIETQIELLKKSIKKLDEIINEEFSTLLDYNPNLVHKLRKGMTYGTQSSNNISMNVFEISIADVKDKKMRFSARSKNPIFTELEEKIHSIGSISLGSIVSDVHNGISPIYDKDGAIPVVKTAHVSNSGLATTFEEFVSDELYEKYPNAQIKKYDVLLCNIGKCSLGKVCINESDEKMFAATETMIIRVDETKYNPYFLTYFLQSILGYSQSEKEYTGTTNQIHISPTNISEFYIPDISKPEQDILVDRINKKVELESKKLEEIEELRNRIQIIISKVCSAE